ncbi:DinB family protein [Emticicia sp. TH156]|uniref:DinB family protein n=1 Tax=Emticicia sp. TH156 TaxID=2067454 RepID=UPI000C773E97|nr:DinB family protein [Emticicia sp. TH156]PLK44600.1 damage-inducible protein DinB [Emticicia sp. TH156]
MKAYFLRLFEHEHWANAEVLASYLQVEQPPARAIELLSHMVSAQRIWIERLQGVSSATKVWELYKKEQLKDLLAANFNDLNALLESVDFNRMVTYRNSLGAVFTSSASDILTHLALHAAYHRGQVVQLLKGHVSPLPATDYIFYYR